MTRVVIVDDHPVFRRGLAALLKASGLQVAGEAASAAEAVAVVDAVAPDVVLMDLGLPDMSGITVTAQITARHPEVRVVVITMYNDGVTVHRALEAGAAGFVTKDALPAQIIAAIRAAESGATMLGPGVPLPSLEAPAMDDEPSGYQSLTERERAIARLLAQGLPNPIIAERLGLSSKTVANYVSNVVLKLQAEDRHDAARLMRRGDERRLGRTDAPQIGLP
ncbi:response regulator [Streptosporangium sp. NPDC087985]|uniref:response regulator n=1 Tax=Streptosporangium sp. NPDC087985 TaxID=3366196 RepID=UPI0038104566